MTEFRHVSASEIEAKRLFETSGGDIRDIVFECFMIDKMSEDEFKEFEDLAKGHVTDMMAKMCDECDNIFEQIMLYSMAVETLILTVLGAIDHVNMAMEIEAIERGEE